MIKRNLLPLYLSQSLRQFALSLFSLFSAIYVYKTFNSLSMVFLFYLLFHLTKLLTAYMAEEMALRWGLKFEVFLGHGFLIWGVLLMMMMAKGWLVLVLAAICWGLSAGFYWFGWYGLMAKGSLSEYGRCLGEQQMVNLIPALLSPILGGFIIQAWGYWALFLLALIIVILSLFGLGKLPDEKTHYDTTPQEIIGLFKTHKRMVLSYFGDSGASTIYTVVFPLYLYLILNKELSLGKFFSLTVIVVTAINFLIGILIDRKGKKSFLAYGSVLSFLIWLGRIASKRVGWLFVVEVVDKVIGKMTAFPLEILTYEKALNGGSTGRAILFRETAIELGSIFACAMLFFIKDLRLAFVLASYLVLLPLLLVKKKGMYGDETEV